MYGYNRSVRMYGYNRDAGNRRKQRLLEAPSRGLGAAHQPGVRGPYTPGAAPIPRPRNVVATSGFLASRRELPNGGQRFSGRQPA